MPLVLASSSIYRQQLLQKLHMPFKCQSPSIDEQAQPGETAEVLVDRLAYEKAKAIAKDHKNSVIIGSDQVASLDNAIITKPHSHEDAVAQLTKASGRCVTFYTGLCLYNTQTQETQRCVESFKVHFLELKQEQIECYLALEKPYQCAGSFKSEGLGITLFSKLEGDDPNTLIGLPLIRLIAMLRHWGLEPLNSAKSTNSN